MGGGPMRNCVCFTFMLILSFRGYAQERMDDYSIPVVKSLVAERRQGFSSGTADKTLPRLGDRAAIALAKMLSEKEIKDPDTIKKIILPLLLDSFAAPSLISFAADRHPKVTIALLN